MSTTTTTRTIRVDQLARVEGEGALTLRLQGDTCVGVELRIFEPPRLFEALLLGRGYHEAPDITARICGICPVAYQMSACHAVERALGVTVEGPLRELRRLLYCGEWIESHALHMVMLHAPDFLGVSDVMALAKLAPEKIKAALRIKKAGNAIVGLLGGREIHPINVKVGGFYKLPSVSDMAALATQLEAARAELGELATWISTFEFPEFQRDIELVSLRHPDEYPLCEGRLVSTGGLDIDVADYEAHIVEEQVPHSTALHARIVGRGPFVCGPLARFVLNHDKLTPFALDVARIGGIDPTLRNPFKSILVRAVELAYAFDEALRILHTVKLSPPASVAVSPRAGVGRAVSEAPRGILFHRYEISEDGAILSAKIVPPTSQNQRSIELDLEAMGPALARLPLPEATQRAEHAIRNYDPCISCSTHFLTLRIEEVA